MGWERGDKRGHWMVEGWEGGTRRTRTRGGPRERGRESLFVRTTAWWMVDGADGVGDFGMIGDDEACGPRVSGGKWCGRSGMLHSLPLAESMERLRQTGASAAVKGRQSGDDERLQQLGNLGCLELKSGKHRPSYTCTAQITERPLQYSVHDPASPTKSGVCCAWTEP